MSSTAIKAATSVRTNESRCRMCGHVIYSRESVAAGIGRDCRRRLLRALAVADVAVVDAFRLALAGHEPPTPAVSGMGRAAGGERL